MGPLDDTEIEFVRDANGMIVRGVITPKADIVESSADTPERRSLRDRLFGNRHASQIPKPAVEFTVSRDERGTLTGMTAKRLV